MEGIPWHEVDWLRDAHGTAHALRESEYPHHVAFCGKYLRGGDFLKHYNLYGTCLKCRHYLDEPVKVCRTESVPRAVLLGRGVTCVTRQGKGRAE